MASFQVPQFIDEKPKIISFFTVKQFLLLSGAALVSVILFYIFSMFLWVILSSLIVGIAIAFGFLKINGQDFTKIIQAAFNYYWSPKKYIWQRAMEESLLDISSIKKISSLRRSMSIQEKLKKMADSITTGKKIKPENSLPDGTKLPKGRYEVVTYLTGEKRAAKRVDF